VVSATKEGRKAKSSDKLDKEHEKEKNRKDRSSQKGNGVEIIGLIKLVHYIEECRYRQKSERCENGDGEIKYSESWYR
jgi:hypothetical protein